jgi:ankyrin repeat protein
MNVILAPQNSTSPSSVNDVDTSNVASRATPTLAIREFFFSLLSEADRKRAEIGCNSATRRFDGFIRFVSNLPEKIRGASAREGADLVWAARERNITTVMEKIAAHADINHADAHGMTAMMYAAQNGTLEMVRTLTTAGSAVNMQNKDGKTPLLLAIESGKFDVVNFLIESGADPEKADQNGCTPLMYAARHGCSKTIALLLSLNVKAAVQNKEGWTALMLAARYGNQTIATAIINTANRKGANEILVISFLQASRLFQFGVFEAMVRAHQNSIHRIPAAGFVAWVLQNNLKLGAIAALADSGMKLTQEEYRELITKHKVSEDAELYLHEVTVGGMVSRRTSLHTNLSCLISANSGGEIHHPLQTGPDGFDAGFTVAFATQEAAEAGDEAHHRV